MRTAARQLALALLTNGSASQTFLGARWIRRALAAAPPLRRRALALRLLALSPHYFYPDGDADGAGDGRMALLEQEHQRMRVSRTRIAERVVAPRLAPGATVLDFGCGPGFLAVALGGHAQRVIGCDISDGVLACAEVVNPAPNVEYVLVEPAAPLPLADASVDVVCSFAVLQHVTGAAMDAILADLRRVLRPDGVALLHVPVDKDDWRSETAWRADTSARGRLRLRYGLNCFGRTRAEVLAALDAAGLPADEVVVLGELGDLHDPDLEAQELFVCRRAPR
jgi:SAM-dependent methyltransferase